MLDLSTRRIVLVVAVLAAPVMERWLPTHTAAQESITLKTVIPSVNSFVPESLTITLEPAPSIRVSILHKASGRSEVFLYPCASPVPAIPGANGPAQACTINTDEQVAKMILGLSNANLSQRSLWRRIFDRLLVDFPDRFAGGAAVQ